LDWAARWPGHGRKSPVPIDSETALPFNPKRFGNRLHEEENAGIRDNVLKGFSREVDF
jgi:hypothetical protein